MTQTIKELCERKSVRAFTDREITKEEKDAIILAATMAPTAGNQQMYTILDVTSPEIKRRLVDTCDHQPFIADSKMLLIFLADFRKWYDAFVFAGCEPRLPGVGDLMLAVTDAAIAAQNAVTAAESLGIGSCYIGDIMENYEAQRELLRLPEYVFPACMLVFGYPEESQKTRKKPGRAPIKHIVHENSYRAMSAGELEDMLTHNTGALSYDEWIKRFCARKYDSDFSREMTRSVGKYIEQFTDGSQK